MNSITPRFCLFAVIALFVNSGPALAGQDYNRVAPNLPPKMTAPALVPPSETLPKSGSQAPLAPALKGLVFVAGPERLIATGLPVSSVDSTGVDASQIPELNDPAFTEQLSPLIGKPVTLAELDRIKVQTTTWLRAHQRPFVDVSVPAQNIASGVVQVVVTQYKLNQVKVAGAHYFSPSLIKETSGLQSGQTLRLDDLQTDLDRLNRNPFLNVDAVFQPGDQTGETDVTLNAKDRLPLRAYAGYDNLGARSLGVSESNFGMNWGNVFGTGQILSYQFTRSLTGRYTSHSVSDTVPLPWGDQLLIFGSYGNEQPLMGQVFNDQGHSGQASVRYVHPLPRIRGLTQDLQIGYDFKSTDNNLEFAGFQVFGAQAEVDQFPLIYDATLSDRFGQTAVQNMFVFSPGRLTANNTTVALSALVPGSRADYIYDRFLVTRTMPLPKSFSAVTRITLQGSKSNLPYSEQVGGGGVGSVRGYYTDTAFGSDGELFSQELRLPAFSLSRMLDRKSESGDKAQFGIFFDYADLRQVTPIPDLQSPVELASVGYLARYSISRYLDLQYDMGWRLRRASTVPERGAYGQVSLTGSF